MPTDLEIARSVALAPIADVARERLGVADEHLVPYGRHKAKLALPFVRGLAPRPDAKLVLVTAVSPTPAGEGKTTTTVGLADALARRGRRAAVALREPSLGPVFGLKGGAAGGGRSQVVPMEDINLHFTGDFAAIALAHNLLAAALDNHVHHGNALGIDVRRISWKRVVDLNDRALRETVVGLGGAANGYPRSDGFDIVVASEVMAVFCLAGSLADLKRRLGDMVVAETRDRRPVTARDLKVHGAMAALLKDALAPNLVQTLEGTPAFVHGGPFANIAHGCNSVLATRTALALADIVVTEAGFGADLGAQKFCDIKCRQSGLRPHAAVVVATLRALKYHGGAALADVGRPDAAALAHGFANLDRHLDIVSGVYGLPCVVALNAFDADTPAEIDALAAHCAARGVPMAVARHWAEGGAGALALADEVLGLVERPSRFAFAHGDDEGLWAKFEQLALKVHGAAGVTAPKAVRERVAALEAAGRGGLGVCIAKTPYSFGSDPAARDVVSGHVIDLREVRLAAGAGFVVFVCGDVMTMPGLPKAAAFERIDVDDDGNLSGLA